MWRMLKLPTMMWCVWQEKSSYLGISILPVTSGWQICIWLVRKQLETDAGKDYVRGRTFLVRYYISSIQEKSARRLCSRENLGSTSTAWGSQRSPHLHQSRSIIQIMEKFEWWIIIFNKVFKSFNILICVHLKPIFKYIRP